MRCRRTRVGSCPRVAAARTAGVGSLWRREPSRVLARQCVWRRSAHSVGSMTGGFASTTGSKGSHSPNKRLSATASAHSDCISAPDSTWRSTRGARCLAGRQRYHRLMRAQPPPNRGASGSGKGTRSKFPSSRPSPRIPTRSMLQYCPSLRCCPRARATCSSSPHEGMASMRENTRHQMQSPVTRLRSLSVRARPAHSSQLPRGWALVRGFVEQQSAGGSRSGWRAHLTPKVGLGDTS